MRAKKLWFYSNKILEYSPAGKALIKDMMKMTLPVEFNKEVAWRISILIAPQKDFPQSPRPGSLCKISRKFSGIKAATAL